MKLFVLTVVLAIASLTTALVLPAHDIFESTTGDMAVKGKCMSSCSSYLNSCEAKSKSAEAKAYCPTHVCSVLKVNCSGCQMCIDLHVATVDIVEKEGSA